VGLEAAPASASVLAQYNFNAGPRDGIVEYSASNLGVGVASADNLVKGSSFASDQVVNAASPWSAGGGVLHLLGSQITPGQTQNYTTLGTDTLSVTLHTSGPIEINQLSLNGTTNAITPTFQAILFVNIDGGGFTRLNDPVFPLSAYQVDVANGTGITHAAFDLSQFNLNFLTGTHTVTFAIDFQKSTNSTSTFLEVDDLTISDVPEPASMLAWLGLASVGAVIGYRRKMAK